MRWFAMSALLAQQILAATTRIGHLGQYVGSFEWALYAWFTGTPIEMHFANSSFDVVDNILPSLAPRFKEQAAGKRRCHIAWCKASMEWSDDPHNKDSSYVRAYVLIRDKYFTFGIIWCWYARSAW